MSGLRKIVFACSFGAEVGIGHAGRCSSLSQFAKLRGWDSVLWTNSDLHSIPAEMRASFQDVLTGSWKDGDLPESVASGDCIVVDDMYSPDEDYDCLRQRFEARNSKALLLAVDDLKKRHLRAADFVLNQEVGLCRAAYQCRRASLLGERFALLRSGLAQPEHFDWDASNDAIPVLVMIGGTDAFRLTPRVLNGLSRYSEATFSPIIVARDDHPDSDLISEQLSRFGSGMRLSGLSSSELAGWCACCSFTVIACGTSTYEMAALGKPFIGLQVVDNQRSMGAAIAEHWNQPIMDCEMGKWDEERFSFALRKLTRSDAVLETTVDLEGANRVLDTVEKA